MVTQDRVQVESHNVTVSTWSHYKPHIKRTCNSTHTLADFILNEQKFHGFSIVYAILNFMIVESTCKLEKLTCIHWRENIIEYKSDGRSKLQQRF